MKKYLSLVKFTHTIFAMPFAVLGFFMAATLPNERLQGWDFLAVLLCMIFARSAAMAFNRYIDRDVDALNPRTALREIPAGQISPQNALFFVVVNGVLFIATTLFINRLCFFLSPVALAVILGYSYSKRFTALCHFILGVGLSLAPVGAYIAVTERFDLAPVLLGLAVLFWVSGFDIIYALQDEEFDKQKSLYSIPAMLGKERALQLSVLLHCISAGLIIALGFWLPFGLLYAVGATIFIALLIYQHVLVKPTDLSRVNMAFFTLNGIASLVFGAFAIADLLLVLPASLSF